jgi:hypothetical protein
VFAYISANILAGEGLPWFNDPPRRAGRRVATKGKELIGEMPSSRSCATVASSKFKPSTVRPVMRIASAAIRLYEPTDLTKGGAGCDVQQRTLFEAIGGASDHLRNSYVKLVQPGGQMNDASLVCAGLPPRKFLRVRFTVMRRISLLAAEVEIQVVNVPWIIRPCRCRTSED